MKNKAILCLPKSRIEWWEHLSKLLFERKYLLPIKSGFKNLEFRFQIINQVVCKLSFRLESENQSKGKRGKSFSNVGILVSWRL